MRKLRHYLAALCAICLLPTLANGQSDSTQRTDPMDVFLDANPKAVEVPILSEGTMVYLCANDTALFVRLSIGNPMIFMRMLMQGVKISIDPTGTKKKRYSVTFPSAREVQDNMEEQRNTNGRPDIGPLVMELNTLGAVYDVSTKDGARFSVPSLIELDTENGILSYYLLIPKKHLLSEKKLAENWTIGIYVENPIGVLEGPRDGGQIEPPQPPSGQSDGARQPSNQEIEKLMMRKIDAWSTFSIDDVNSINLK